MGLDELLGVSWEEDNQNTHRNVTYFQSSAESDVWLVFH